MGVRSSAKLTLMPRISLVVNEPLVDVDVIVVVVLHQRKFPDLKSDFCFV